VYEIPETKPIAGSLCVCHNKHCSMQPANWPHTLTAVSLSTQPSSLHAILN